MRAAILALGFAFAALPAGAQDYYATTAAALHGNGYAPSTIVAGWEGEEAFTVIAITADGKRVAAGAPTIDAATEWKLVVTTGPRAAAEDDDEEDDRYLDKAATNPKPAAPRGPPVPRKEVSYSSLTCPAVMARMTALKPLASFEFDPPLFKGNQDGAIGDGREGYDLWTRVGGAELKRSAESKDSALGRWFDETVKALDACPAA